MRAVMSFALWALAALLAAGEASISFKKVTETSVESAGQVTLELDQKFIPKDGSLSVTWRTVVGTALPGYDYVAASGTMVIGDKDKKPTIAVALIDDLANTGSRQFTVELVSATGATVVAAAASCVVTITEDDTAMPPAQVAAPLLTPVSGTFSDPIVATASTTTVGAELRYRLDGADPTTSDPLLPPAGLTIDRGTNLTVRGFYPRWLASPVASATYAFAVAPVTASLAAGTYIGAQSVTLASLTAGAEIRYTLDGSTPGTASLLATGAIELPGSVTLQAVALRDGWIASPVFSAAYTLAVAAPSLAPQPGTYTEAVTIAATLADPAAVVRYTLDGTAPADSSPAWPADGLLLDRGATLQAVAFRAGWSPSSVVGGSYAFTVAPVTASLAAGTYTGVQSVTLASLTAGAEIRYTLDGTTPGAASLLATGAIELPGSVTLKAVALRDGWIASPVFSAVYTLRVVAPTLNPTPGTFAAPMTIAAALADAQAVLRYTLDGTTPSVASDVWPVDGVAIDRSTTVRVRAFRAGWSASAVVGGTYTLRVAAVTADPKAGTYTGGRTVALATTTPTAVIRYTLDGSLPTAASALYTAPIELSGTTTLRAVASRDGWRDSPVLRAVYTLRVPTPVLSPAAGTYSQAPVVTASVADAQAVLRYTVDGTAPTVASPLLPADGLQLTSTATVRVIATRDGWANSAVVRATYTLRNATPVASLPAGTYTGAQQITLTSASPGAEIRYTLDGTTPTAASPLAAGPVLIEGNKTLRAIALQPGWSNSATLRAAYALRVPAPQPTPAAGTYTAWPLVTAASSDALATVRYTTGATLPNAWSRTFPSAGLQLTAATTLSFVATRSGWTVSLPTTASYARDLPPAAAAVSATTDEDVAVVVVPSASDADSATLTWSIVTPPSHGALSGFDAATGAATYTPATDWNGSDTYALAVADALTTVAVPVTVAVAAVDDAAVIAVPGSEGRSAGSDHLLAVSISDIDSETGTVEFTTSHGTLRAIPHPDVAATGMGTAHMVLSGPIEALSLVSTGIIYRAPETSTSDVLTVTIGESSASAAFAVPAVAGSTVLAVNDQTVIEAEEAHRVWAGRTGVWSVSGTAQALGHPTPVDLSGLGTESEIQFDVLVQEAGDYLLWVNAAADTMEARVGCLVDGTVQTQAQDVRISGVPGFPAWSNKTTSGGEARVFLSAGLHRVSIVATTTGLILDRVLFLRDPGARTATLVPALPHADGARIVIDVGDVELGIDADGHRWMPRPDGSMANLPDVGGFWSEAAGAGLVYNAVFTDPGVWYAWVLGDGLDEAGNSVHLTIDGATSANGISWAPAALGSLSWARWSNAASATAITVPSAGVHEIGLWAREDGVRVRQIVLTRDAAWTPPAGSQAPSLRVLPRKQSADGTLVLEAESAQHMRAFNSTAWTQIANGTASGGSAMRVLADTGLFFSYSTADLKRSPMIAWTVWFDQPGTYRIWSRGAAMDGGSDSLHAGIDNTVCPKSFDLGWFNWNGLNVWNWVSKQPAQTAAEVVVPTAGFHTVHVWAREDGFALDKIVLTSPTAAAPVGSGPSESGTWDPTPLVPIVAN
jgi:hypothetical protein